jgi:hypothetical protein
VPASLTICDTGKRQWMEIVAFARISSMELASLRVSMPGASIVHDDEICAKPARHC